jgi:DNA-binding response OmpR family regulator
LTFVVAPSVDEPAASLATRSSSTHVLVVARDEAILELLTYIFRCAAIESISASSIASALHAFRAQTSTVVVVDSYGLVVTREFIDTVGSPIVVLATDEPDELVAGPALRQLDYMQKPFSGTELVARVRVHLGRLAAGASPSLPPTGGLGKLRQAGVLGL